MNRNYINKFIKDNNIDETQYNQGNHKFNSNTLFDLVLDFCFNCSNNVQLGKEYNTNRNSISSLRNCKTYINELSSLGYTKTKKPFYSTNQEYTINDINENTYYTNFK